MELFESIDRLENNVKAEIYPLEYCSYVQSYQPAWTFGDIKKKLSEELSNYRREISYAITSREDIAYAIFCLSKQRGSSDGEELVRTCIAKILSSPYSNELNECSETISRISKEISTIIRGPH